ncbi:MAG: molybdenum cofactor guanylyltransferase [Acidimicrobiales bacterium]|nr:molybdenum cofactor guanylyltransferase [Acidimicrobiales bacterium]
MTTGLGGAVLAGGASRRMGVDKALIEVDGEALVRRAVAALSSADAQPVLVVGGDQSGIEALGLAYVPDQWPGEGPLGGIITALRSIDAEIVAVLSCDLTEASSIAVRSVVGALGDADVAVPVVAGQAEWLHAAWRRSSLGTLEAQFAEGVRSPRHAVAGLRVAQLLDGDPCWFHDADRPEDLPPTR